MGKGKKRNRSNGPAELVVVEAEQYPAAVIVELWHKNAKGKREFLDSRRYEATVPDDGEDEEEAVATDPAELVPLP
ncbi:MAG: hypothetical protein M3O77_02090 [Chloroflexota bacterium]|nr:hypothetical protein [Chloroflexota bacterium]